MKDAAKYSLSFKKLMLMFLKIHTIVFVIIWVLPGSERFSEANYFGIGRGPLCAIGPDEKLHIAYEGSQAGRKGVEYITLNAGGVLSTPESVPGSQHTTADRTGFITVDLKGGVHVSWMGGYNNKLGGAWKKYARLRTTGRVVTIGPIAVNSDQSIAYTSAWNDGQRGFEITQLTSEQPLAKDFLLHGHKHRPTTMLGPAWKMPGDGKIHVNLSGMSASHAIFNGLDKETPKLDVTNKNWYGGDEGNYMFFMRDNEVGVIYNGNRETVGFASNNIPKTQILPNGTTKNRVSVNGVYDPIHKKAYLIWEKHGIPHIGTLDPNTKKFEIIGQLGSNTGCKPRRWPAAGLALRENGGVHVVYSQYTDKCRMYHRVVDGEAVNASLMFRELGYEFGARKSGSFALFESSGSWNLLFGGKVRSYSVNGRNY